MSNAILAVGDSTRLVTQLAHGLSGRELFFSYGREIPDLSSYDVSYWMGGLYALKLQQLGLALHLCSPGAEWLPGLEPSVTGRTVYSGLVSELQEFSGELFVKPAEAKIRALPAGFYTPADVARIFAAQGFTEAIQLQWTTERLSINYEHRFFVAAGKVITGSPYLVNGGGWHESIDSSRFEEAKAFAQFVLNSYPDSMPPAFVLDVGLNELTDKWFVIEANRAWSSGLYGSNPALALEVIDEACSYAGELWRWKPDSHLRQVVADAEPITVATEPEEESVEYHRLRQLA
jgi:hypothetical protein